MGFLPCCTQKQHFLVSHSRPRPIRWENSRNIFSVYCRMEKLWDPHYWPNSIISVGCQNVGLFNTLTKCKSLTVPLRNKQASQNCLTSCATKWDVNCVLSAILFFVISNLMRWEKMLQGRRVNRFLVLSWQSIEVLVIQGGAYQSILMAAHANCM